MSASGDHAWRRSAPLILCLACLALAACHRQKTDHAPARFTAVAVDFGRPLPKTPPGGLAEAGYVGALACRPCHSKIYESYARHSMASSGIRPLASLDRAWLARIFDAGAAHPLRHPRSGTFYRPLRKGEDYFVEEYRLAKGGTRTGSRLQPITFSLSAGSYGLAFYFRDGLRLHHAPIDYYAKLARWDFDPVAFGGDPGFRTALGTYCISCHSDYPRRRAGAREIFYPPLPTGIGCERCHGPGARHVASMDAKDIVNPAHLSRTLQLDVCAQCHQSSAPIVRAQKGDFDVRPGQPLSAFRVDFVSVTPEPDRFDLLAHPERLARSACFRGGRLTCTSCHDPHVSSRDEPESYWDQKCLACHRDRPCSAPETLRARQGDHCPRCHMRAGPTANVPLVSVTDHFIQKRPPPIRPGPLTRGSGIEPLATLLGEPLSGEDVPAVLALAQARIGRPEKALALAPVELSRPRLPALDAWLANHELSLGHLEPANRAFAALLAADPNSEPGLLGYARTTLSGQGARAAELAAAALDRLLALDPENGAARKLRQNLPAAQ